MATLPKFNLEFNKETENWDLENVKSGKVIQTFPTKEKATQSGVLKKAIGEEGGSVKIKKINGRIQEERTFPRSKDPKKSKG